MTTSIVVARYQENVDWVHTLPKDIQVHVYTKGLDVPNVGRESSTYLHHIITQYDSLTDEVIFCQGDPFDHVPDFIQRVADGKDTVFGLVSHCDGQGMPDHPLGVSVFSKSVLGYSLPKYTFIVGAQFKVTREQIHAHPKAFYVTLFREANASHEAPYLLERLWSEIFGILDVQK